MLHHVSFNTRDPERAAQGLAPMLGAQAIRAPQPPFPQGAWFIVYGDSQGSLIEILPWGKVLDPEAPGGMRDDADMRPRHGTHVLLETSQSIDTVLSLAKDCGWRAVLTSAGLFSFVKVWVADDFLVEIMTPEQADDYRTAFNGEGLATLDAKLRALEASINESLRTRCS